MSDVKTKEKELSEELIRDVINKTLVLSQELTKSVEDLVQIVELHYLHKKEE